MIKTKMATSSFSKIKIIIFFIILATTIFFYSCATPNDSITLPEENQIISLSHFYGTQGYAMDISVTDSMLYIAEDQAGFSIHNLNSNELVFYYDDHSNFQNYRLIHADETNNWLFAYNKYGNTSIQVFNIEQKDSLTLLPAIQGQTQEVGKIKFFANSQDTLRLNYINENYKYQFGGLYLGYWYAEEVSSYSFDYSISDFDTDSSFLYIACEQLGIQLVSLDSGIVKGGYNTTGEAIAVLVDENLVYVADKQEGISIVDFSDINNPVLLYQYDTSGYAQSVDFNENYLAVGSGGGGVYLFDISDKQNISFIERYDPDDFGYTYKVVLKNNKIFASTKKGVYELEINNE